MESNQNQQAQKPEISQQPIILPTDSKDFLMSKVGQDIKRFELTQRIARMYNSSSIVPATYQGEKNIGNVVIALDMADRLNANPIMVMQNLYVVHGNPSWSSKFLVATVNSCGRFTPLRYEFKGDEGSDQWACRCYAYEISDKEHTEPLYGDWISINMAKLEGWYGKSGSKWKTMPGQMLRYRAAAFWQRVYAPEISMGLITVEEAEDTRTVVDAVFEEMPVQQKHIGFQNPAQQVVTTPTPTAQPASAPQPSAPKSATELFGQ